MEVDIEEDENEPDLTYPYEEVDPLNPPSPASKSEPEGWRCRACDGFGEKLLKGIENVSADALSRIHNEAQLLSLFTSSPVTTKLLRKIEATWEEDNELKAKVDQLKKGDTVINAYVWENQQLRRKGKLVVGNNAALRT
ncbi:hypothetical protein Tco_1075668 [Tanacetum coccineum]